MVLFSTFRIGVVKTKGDRTRSCDVQSGIEEGSERDGAPERGERHVAVAGGGAAHPR